MPFLSLQVPQFLFTALFQKYSLHTEAYESFIFLKITNGSSHTHMNRYINISYFLDYFIVNCIIGIPYFTVTTNLGAFY